MPSVKDTPSTATARGACFDHHCERGTRHSSAVGIDLQAQRRRALRLHDLPARGPRRRASTGAPRRAPALELPGRARTGVKLCAPTNAQSCAINSAGQWSRSAAVKPLRQWGVEGAYSVFSPLGFIKLRRWGSMRILLVEKPGWRRRRRSRASRVRTVLLAGVYPFRI